MVGDGVELGRGAAGLGGILPAGLWGSLEWRSHQCDTGDRNRPGARWVGTRLIISFVIIIIVFFSFYSYCFSLAGIEPGASSMLGQLCLMTELCSQLFLIHFLF